MEEIWKDIVGFEGRYQISNLGNVKSLIRNRLLSINSSPTGYQYISLRPIPNGKQKRFYVHRLVASAFIDNPNNYKEVNHKNEIKSDNCVNNLEWCTRQYNNNYGTANKRMAITKGTPIVQLSLSNKLLNIYVSARDCARVNKYHSYAGILRCCRGLQEKSFKYKWMFLDDYNSLSQNTSGSSSPQSQVSK